MEFSLSTNTMSKFEMENNKILKTKKIKIVIGTIFAVIITIGILLTQCSDKINIFIPRKINQAVSSAIISQSAGYYQGEVASEGHKILKIDKGENETKVYVIASCGNFAFENNIFTNISGSGPIPTVITLSKNSNGEYSTIDYQEPEDGIHNAESLNKMFPPYLRQSLFIFEELYYPTILRQHRAYANDYLVLIGRKAIIESGSLDVELDNISDQASNDLGSMYNDYPYWVGSLEQIEDGIRYVYEKGYEDKGNGNGIVTYTKSIYGGNVVEKAVIEVKNDKIIYLEGEERHLLDEG